MAFNFEDSQARVRKHLQDLESKDIEISKLSREMDFDNLSPTNCRDMRAVHLYADVTNMSRLVNDEVLSDDDYARLLRCCEVMMREEGHIVSVSVPG